MRRTVMAAVLALHAAALSAATFVVPTDAELASKAKAIAVGTVLEVNTIATPEGGIETQTTIRIDDAIKGALEKQDLIQVTELGGVAGDTALVIPGTPIYSVGEEVLIFLERNRRGGWSTADLALGKFEAVDGPGRGWSRRELRKAGRAASEKPRDDARFRNYLRKLEKGERADEDYFLQSVPLDPKLPRFQIASSSEEVLHALWTGEMSVQDIQLVQTTSYSPSSFLMTVSSSTLATRPVRWSRFDGSAPQSVAFRTVGTQTGLSDSVGAAQRALAAWTDDASSSVSYTYGGTAGTSGGLRSKDGVNAILFNDPAGEIAGAWTGSGTVAVGGFWVTSTTNSFKGQTFYTITEGDVVVQNGLSLAAKKFDEGLTHELGHTLGFRHSNQGTPSTSAAVMNSTVSGLYGTALQSWDRQAVSTVYGSGTTTTTPPPTTTTTSPSPPPGCTAPALTSQTGALRVTVGSAATVRYPASGTTPLTYRIYEGMVGNTSTLRRSSTSYNYLRVSSSTKRTRYFWAEVSNACGKVRSQQSSVTWY